MQICSLEKARSIKNQDFAKEPFTSMVATQTHSNFLQLLSLTVSVTTIYGLIFVMTR
jgi:hypothetical protein